ncbi:TPA: EAL domain-containing response regulator [Vibrio parahaemolyticus]
MRALIVEDDRIHALKLTFDLSSLGFEQIQIANDSEQALHFLSASNFDYIFCDIHLGETGGAILLYRMSYIAKSAHLVIVSGSKGDVIYLTECLGKELGYRTVSRADKPYLIENLKKIIAQNENIEKNNRIDNVEVNKLSMLLTHKDLLQAIDKDEIINHYQPQLDFSTKKIIGAESLIRWNHPELGLLYPNLFISLFESLEPGLLFKISMKNTMDTFRSINRNINFSINLTAKDLNCDFLFNEIISRCDSVGFPLHRLILELTEGHLYTANSLALATLARLKLKGAKLSIDDLGVGYSSLSKLASIPFDELKIDKDFIKNINRDRRNITIVKALIGISKELGITNVIEGVENEDTFNLLKSMGGDICQGFYTGKPLEPQEFIYKVNDENASW